MDIQEIANGLVALCKEGKFRAAIDAYYGDNIVSQEVDPNAPESKGIDAIRAKSDWFEQSMEVHSMAIEGPWINSPQFAVRFTLDATDKGSGHRMNMDEIAVYTVEGEKIVLERFLYGG